MGKTHSVSKPESRSATDFSWVSRMRCYTLLMKPRVMSLVVFTGAVGLFMAPTHTSLLASILTIICIALGAGASGAINMWYDRDIDIIMHRTKNRPIPAGQVFPIEALVLGLVGSIVSVTTLTWFVNPLAGSLLAITIAFYILVYTVWLKRRTPQNIVIGGASGAFPPVIGWVAATGSLDWGAVILFAIIFMWTPPHFWALALFRSDDYKAVNVPMMPIVAGKRKTRKLMLIYTLALVPITIAPAFIGMSSVFYGIVASVVGIQFINHALKVWHDETGKAARPMFLFSIRYLFYIFIALLADKAIMASGIIG